ncbi:hypothetical protein CBR_g38827 [Chara braunii]|uniref:Uncharacterized protein n=1 Tax=Chara braunii TaxID=69332 RepID=A0A388LQM1_CHABU|nr:hypothetical protein CBR_g38827 [Chara braunii]|eukprot:GBG84545.1 hypothetical protein CBR_g38827 [Chara braunii]
MDPKDMAEPNQATTSYTDFLLQTVHTSMDMCTTSVAAAMMGVKGANQTAVGPQTGVMSDVGRVEVQIAENGLRRGGRRREPGGLEVEDGGLCDEAVYEGRSREDFQRRKTSRYAVGRVMAAMAPCMQLYAFLGSSVKAALKSIPDEHPYADWIRVYASVDFETAN